MTSFGIEDEELEDEKDWRQIQLKAAGISTSAHKIMKQKSSTKGKGGMIKNLLNSKKGENVENALIEEKRHIM